MKNKFYGILIALLPFISGTYKSLGDWSSSEAFGYNIFNLALIVFGLYLATKSSRKAVPVSDKDSFDTLIFNAQRMIKELESKAAERWKLSDSTDTSTTELRNELKEALKLFNEARTKTNYDSFKLVSISKDLRQYLGVISDLNRKNDIIWAGTDKESVDKAVEESRDLIVIQKDIEDRLKHFIKS